MIDPREEDDSHMRDYTQTEADYDWEAYWEMLDRKVDEQIANQPEEDEARE